MSKARPKWPASAVQAADRPRLAEAGRGWPRLAEARGSLEHDQALIEASGEPAGRGLSHIVFRIARHDHAPQHVIAGAHPDRDARVRVALGGRALHKVAQRQPVSLDARRRPVVQVRRPATAASGGGVRVFMVFRVHVHDTRLAASGASAVARAWLRRHGLRRLRRTAAKAIDDGILLAELVGESGIDTVIAHRRRCRLWRCRRRARARVSHQPVEKVATLHLHAGNAKARLLRSRAPARMCARACACAWVIACVHACAHACAFERACWCSPG